MRPANAPQQIQIEVGQPEGVGIVIVVFGPAVFIHRQLSNLQLLRVTALTIGIVGDRAVHVVQLVPPHQRVPQIGIKLGAQFRRATLHIDTSEIVIPHITGFLCHLIEASTVRFGFEVQTRIVDTGKRHRYLHIDHFARSHMLKPHHTGLIFKPIRPCIELRDGLVQFHHKESSHLWRAAPLAIDTVVIAFQLPIANSRHVTIDHFRRATLAT